jgi:hypothetical protein
LVRRYLPLIALLAVQQTLVWMVLLSHNPETTVTWDCVAGAMGYEALRGWSFSPLDSFDGVLGGMFVASLLGLPLFAAFGVTGLTVKATSALLIAALTTVTWLTWSRFASPLQAVLTTLAVMFVPPVVFISSFMMGQWHFTELIFESLAVWLVLRLVFVDRAGKPLSVGAVVGFGALLGLALFNCFASLVFFPVLLGLLWSLGKSHLRRFHMLGLGFGLIAASSPGWWKLLGHNPYGIDGAVRATVPPQATHSRFELSQLIDMFPGGGFAAALHFDTAFGGAPFSVLTWGLALSVTVGLFLGWIGMLVRAVPSLRALLAGLLPGRPPASVKSVSPAVIPPLMAGIYGCAYLLSELRLRPLDWWLSNPRDHGHTALLPWIVWMAVSGALLLGSLFRESRQGSCVPGEWSRPSRLPRAGLLALAGVLVLAVQIPSLMAMSAMHRHVPSELQAKGLFRGHCWDAFGFYMAPHLHLESGRISDACARFGEVGKVECYRGGAWAIGFLETSRQVGSTLRGGPSPLDSSANNGSAGACFDLPDLWRSECLRGVGWALASGGAGDVSAARSMAEDCDLLIEESDRHSCWLGVGFPIGDHLNSTPPRLRRRLQDLPEQRRQWVVEGAGAQVGRTYGTRASMKQICASWGEDYAESCMRGAEHSLSFRSAGGEL